MLGRHDEVRSLYGQAIDSHLEAGRPRAAEALCRQLLQRYPDVVRARRTLTLLAIGRGDFEAAAALLHEYATAAREKGEESFLRTSLRSIPLLPGAEPVREQAIQELRVLGDEAGAAELMEREYEEPDPEAFDTSGGRWSHSVHAALLEPGRLGEIGKGSV